MQTNSNEWSILEKLLLTQAVHKYGENMWFQVARILKQHELIQQQGIKRPSDFYSQKNCSFQYYLLVEHLESETTHTSRNEIRNDMPVVVRLARYLYAQRIEEIKSTLTKNSEDFKQLANEVNSIRKGQWDSRLREQLARQSLEAQGERGEAAEMDIGHQDKQQSTADLVLDVSDDKENKIERANSSTMAEIDNVSLKGNGTAPTLLQTSEETVNNSIKRTLNRKREEEVREMAIVANKDIESKISQQ